MGKFKVLDMEGNMVIVDQVDAQIHKHLSGRDFTENDACVGMTPKKIKQNIEAIAEYNEIEVEVVEKYTREQAIEAYKEKYGRNPSKLMKTKNIIAKL